MKLSRRKILAAVVLVLAVTGLALLFAPAHTRQGVDYVVTVRELPAYEKALDFVQRDIKYRTLATTVTQGRRTELERLMAVYEWTRRNIRNIPEGFPVVDDHVWHIIVRGYGADDQKADVFTTLATYAGIPAFWTLLRTERPRAALPMSFARVNGRWIVADVGAGVIFTDAHGVPAPVEEIARDRRLVTAAAGDRRYDGLPYAAYFGSICSAGVPRTLRAEKQMLWPRLLFESRALLRKVNLGADAEIPLCDRLAPPTGTRAQSRRQRDDAPAD